MEGLTIKEVLIKDAFKKSLFRLGAEFHTYSLDSTESYYRGSDIIDICQYGTSEELNDQSKGFPVLRLNETDSLFIGTPSKFCLKISQEKFDDLRLCKNDVLICRTNGNKNLVGKATLVAEDVNYAYASYLFKVKPRVKLINPATLAIFLNSKYGRQQINKHSMVSNQANFSPAKFREIKIPKFKLIQNKLENIVFQSFALHKKAKSLYTKAESLLLDTLGFNDFQPSTENISIKSLKDSFLTTGRLDAEYYQKKYEELTEFINRNLYRSLAELVTITKSIEPGSDFYSENEEGIPFLRVADYNNYGITNPSKKISIFFFGKKP